MILLQVEKLIKELPSVPEDWSSGNSTEKGQLSNGVSVQHAENGASLRETQSMLLERIASEMNRLKFYITHAQVFLYPPHEILKFNLSFLSIQMFPNCIITFYGLGAVIVFYFFSRVCLPQIKFFGGFTDF